MGFGAEEPRPVLKRAQRDRFAVCHLHFTQRTTLTFDYTRASPVQIIKPQVYEEKNAISDWKPIEYTVTFLTTTSLAVGIYPWSKVATSRKSNVGKIVHSQDLTLYPVRA
jgi:hypothetical protein